MSIVEVHRAQDLVVLALEGVFDEETCHSLRQRIDAALAAGHGRIVINVGTAGLVEPGLGALVDAASTAAASGASVVVRTASAPARRLLELFGLAE